MKTLQIFHKDLDGNLLVAPRVTGNPQGNKSFAFPISFVENDERNDAKLLLRTKEFLKYGGMKGNIMTFTGYVIMQDETYCPCMGCTTVDGEIKEYWVTIIEAETEIFKSVGSREKFIEMCKTHCTKEGLKITEDGNLVNGFSLSKQSIQYWNLSDEFIRIEEGKVYKEMYKNIFPIVRKPGEILEIYYGEFIDEHTIRIVSYEEAIIRGAL